MSFEAVTWAFKQKVRHSGEKLILIALANYASQQGECYPSQKHLAEICCMGERTVRTHLEALVKAGYVTMETRVSQHGSNVYTIEEFREPDRPNRPLDKTDPAESAAKSGENSRNGPAESAANTKEEIQKNTKDSARDAAADLFALACIAETQVPYVFLKKDWAQIAGLRKAFRIGGKETPPGWEPAVMNYFASPIGKHSLADLCGRFSVFRNSPVNQYGKPINHNAMGSAIEQLQQKIRSEMAQRIQRQQVN